MKWTALLIIPVAATALFAQSEPEAAAKAKVIALEKAWNQAYKLGDTKALGSLLDDSLVLIEDDGSLKTKAEFLASMKSPTANEEQVAHRRRSLCRQRQPQRQALRSSRALCRYLDLEKRKLGVRRY